jgi:hypothetical protein
VCWGGAGFEPRTTDLQSGALPLSHLSSSLSQLSSSTYIIFTVGKNLPVAKTPLNIYYFYKHLGFGCQEMICKLSCKRDENASMYKCENSNIYSESMKSTDLKNS